MMLTKIFKGLEIIILLLLIFILILVFKTGLDYLVNTHASTSKWIVYEKVQAENENYPLGVYPILITTATRYKKVNIYWEDSMYCMFKGSSEYTKMLPPSKSSLLNATPAYIGKPLIQEENKDYLVLSGRWTWDGGLPTQAAKCYVLSQITLNPSLFVYRVINIKSSFIYFGDYIP